MHLREGKRLDIKNLTDSFFIKVIYHSQILTKNFLTNFNFSEEILVRNVRIPINELQSLK